MNYRCLVLMVLCTLSSVPAHAAWLLTSPPREKPEEAQEMYGKLADFLSAQIGEKIIYERPQGWIEYVNNMRAGKYDIVLDGPHFAAWRIKHLNHAPLVKLPGTLTFVVVGKRSDAKLNKLSDLITGGWCGLPSPNLATMAVMSQFNNPVKQPDFIEIQDIVNIIPALKAGRCRAAGLLDKFYKKTSDEDKKDLKVIYTSPTYPDQTITVSPRISAAAREKIIAALTVETGVPAAKGIFEKFAKNTTHFVPAPLLEFEGLEDLLEGVIWGW
ncbi:MAG: PhnD/SsuA/transferrin family substrate-binding protein [Gammaproteobacteria bacterium]|nr:PhnD/SsuA/transferrin family substrate-binding protein [Gammaproteobacteria bacterium]